MMILEPDELCNICCELLEEGDDVVELTCRKRHHFHFDCITEWVRRGNCVCPLCQDDIRQDMEAENIE